MRFANTHQADPLTPSTYLILSYILSLSDKYKSPGTILNYLSGARTWVTALRGDTRAFDAYPVDLMKRGVQRSSSHTPSRAPALSPHHLVSVFTFLQDVGPNGPVLQAALLIGYATLLRQSNLLLSPNSAVSHHALRARDVTRSASGLTLVIRSTKTRWRARDAATIAIVPSEDRSCPVAAWDRYYKQRRPAPDDPAFMLGPGKPLRPAALMAVLRWALQRVGVQSPHAYTLHSLRRGGAQACAAAGATLDHVKTLGSWTSTAVHTYVPRSAFKTDPRT